MKAIDKMVRFLEIFDQDVICAGGNSRGGFAEIMAEARRLAAEEKAGDEGLREFVVRIVERAKYLGHSRVDLPVRILEKSLEMYPSHPVSEQKAPAAAMGDRKWHDLKVISPHWESLQLNLKNFEVRKNDRGFKVGDGLCLRHWEDGEYVVNEAPQYFIVEYVTSFPDGIKDGYVVMGLSRYRPSADRTEELVEKLKEKSKEWYLAGDMRSDTCGELIEILADFEKGAS